MTTWSSGTIIKIHAYSWQVRATNNSFDNQSKPQRPSIFVWHECWLLATCNCQPNSPLLAHMYKHTNTAPVFFSGLLVEIWKQASTCFPKVITHQHTWYIDRYMRRLLLYKSIPSKWISSFIPSFNQSKTNLLTCTDQKYNPNFRALSMYVCNSSTPSLRQDL